MKKQFYAEGLSAKQRIEVDRIWRRRLPLIKYFLREGDPLDELCRRWNLPEERLLEAVDWYSWPKRRGWKARKFDGLTAEQRWLKKRLSSKGVGADERDRIMEGLLLPVNCPILNIKLVYGGRKEHSATLDQIEPQGGYALENIQVISFRANRIKNNAAPDELRAIANYMAVKEKGPPASLFGVKISNQLTGQ